MQSWTSSLTHPKVTAVQLHTLSVSASHHWSFAKTVLLSIGKHCRLSSAVHQAQLCQDALSLHQWHLSIYGSTGWRNPASTLSPEDPRCANILYLESMPWCFNKPLGVQEKVPSIDSIRDLRLISHTYLDAWSAIYKRDHVYPWCTIDPMDAHWVSIHTDRLYACLEAKSTLVKQGACRMSN